MFCEICGEPPSPDGPVDGSGHRCRQVDPARVSTLARAGDRVIKFCVAYLALGLIAIALTAAAEIGRQSWTTGNPAPMRGLVVVSVLAGLCGLVVLVLLVLLTIATLFWAGSAHRVTAAGPGAAGYTGLVAATAMIGTGLTMLPGTAPGTFIAGTALTAGGPLVLIAAVMSARSRIRRLAAGTDTGMPHDPGPAIGDDVRTDREVP